MKQEIEEFQNVKKHKIKSYNKSYLCKSNKIWCTINQRTKLAVTITQFTKLFKKDLLLKL